MKTFRIILWSAVGLAVVVVLALFWTTSQQRSSTAQTGLLSNPIPLEQPGDGASSGHRPMNGSPFSLIEANGEPITEAAFAGRPTVLFFGFTYCPEICPVSLYMLSTLIDDLGDERGDLQAFFISVDPERDTPEVVQSYISPFAHNIRGITGDLASIEALAASWGIFVEKVPLDDGDYTVDHGASILLLDRQGRFRGAFDHRDNPVIASEKLKLILAL